MSERIARVHQSTSNRAQKPTNPNLHNKHKEVKISSVISPTTSSSKSNGKGAKKEGKVVYRSVLDNPFKIDWPKIPANVENALLAGVIELLADVGPYNVEKEKISRKKKHSSRAQTRHGSRAEAKDNGDQVELAAQADSTEAPIVMDEPKPSTGKRKREDQDVDANKRRKCGANEPPLPVDSTKSVSEPPPQTDVQVPTTLDTTATVLVRPQILEHTIFGVNEVTKRLEQQSPSQTGTNRSRRRIRLVLAHLSDIDTPAILAHFPMLVASCNSQRTSDDPAVLLVAFPRGSEEHVAGAAGMRRLAVMAFDHETPGLDALDSFLTSVPVLRASWLGRGGTLIPTHIKQLKTTAPHNMKEAKEERARAKGTAKAKKVEKKKGVRGLGRVVKKAKVVIT